MQRVAILEEALLGSSRVIKSRALLLVPPNERPIHLAVNFPNNYTEYYLIQVMTTVARPNAVTQQGRNRGRRVAEDVAAGEGGGGRKIREK